MHKQNRADIWLRGLIHRLQFKPTLTVQDVYNCCKIQRHQPK